MHRFPPPRPLLALLSIALCTASPADSRPVHWRGWLVENDQRLAIRFDLEARSGTFSSPAWAVLDYPLADVAVAAGHASWRMGDDRFTGTTTRGAMRGNFTGSDGSGTFELHRARAEARPYREVQVTFPDSGARLSGTLCVPDTPGRHAAVVLVHGSGPQTRWGTNRYLADRFARAGIAALAYDKRGCGASGGDWKTAGFETLADDAIAAAGLLAHRSDVDAGRIGILGHSQGGIIASLAVMRAPRRFAFVVAQDSPSGPVRDQDLYRVRNGLKSLRLAPEDEANAMRVFGLFIDAARGARPFEVFDAARAPFLGTDWYAWLGIPPREAWVWASAVDRFEE